MNFEKKTAPAFAPTKQHRFRLWARLREGNSPPRLVVFWPRLVATIVLFTFVGWMGLTGAAWLILRQRHPSAAIRFANLVLPHRWTEHQLTLGRHYLSLARDSTAKNLPSETARLFAAGIARVPDDLVARHQLAAIHARDGNLPAALNVLTGRLDLALNDRSYLQLTFGLLFEMQRHDEALAVTARFLPASPDDSLSHQFLALQAATAHFNLGRYDETEQIVARWRLERSVEGLILLARCDWERGYPDLAQLRLERNRSRFSAGDEIPLFLGRLYRELGLHDRAWQEALVCIAVDPLSPGPRIDLLHSTHQVGSAAIFELEVGKYFRDFANDARALLLIAELAARLGNVALAGNALEFAKRADFPPGPFQVEELKALLTAGDPVRARALAEQLQAEHPPTTQLGVRITGWRAVACFGVRDRTNGELCLQGYLAEQRHDFRDALPLAAALERLGEPAGARQLLVAAVRRNAANQNALTRLVHLDAAQGNLAGLEEYLPRLLKFGKPSHRVLEEAFLHLTEDSPSRTALRRRVKAVLDRVTTNPEPGT